MKELTIKDLENKGFEGIDVSLDISLFEYGLAAKESDGEIKIIYGIKIEGEDYVEFQNAFFSLPLDFDTEFDFAMEDKGFFDCMGNSKEDWLKAPTIVKLHDLFNYYGHENVFGYSYCDGFKIIESE